MTDVDALLAVVSAERDELVLVVRAVALLPDDVLWEDLKEDGFVNGWYPRRCRSCGVQGNVERRRGGPLAGEPFVNVGHLPSCAISAARAWAVDHPPEVASLGRVAFTGDGTAGLGR